MTEYLMSIYIIIIMVLSVIFKLSCIFKIVYNWHVFLLQSEKQNFKKV